MHFVMGTDKQLRRTDRCAPIYKFETGADQIRFFIPQEYNTIKMTDMTCIVQCILPNANGLYKVCQYDEELFKNKLTVTVPITTKITNSIEDADIAEVKLYLLFIKPNEDNSSIADVVLKTGCGKFTIINNGSLDSENESTFDEIWEHAGIDKLTEDVAQLKDTKADSISVENSVVTLKAGEKILGTVQLPDDVSWEEWN